MKLNKKQIADIINRHEGGGIILINMGNSQYREVEFHLGKDGNFYTGNIEISGYFKILKEEIK